jgi:hypothetical protein
MKQSLWRLMAAGSGALVALAMSASTAGATGHHGGPTWPAPAPSVQHGQQASRTVQQAGSHARSTQLAPVNLNAPVQVLSIGVNGGKTVQSNESRAHSAAANRAKTVQVLDQHQATHGTDARRPHHPRPHHPAHRPGGDHDRSCDRGHPGKPGHGPDGHGPKSGHRPEGHPAAVQSGEQQASTEQEARSSATSTQILPVNANVPVQVLSIGSNGGDTEQSNRSQAESSADNESKTVQAMDQGQRVDGGSGHGGAVQSGEQQASTEQEARSSATSTQILPVNANVPVQVLSIGSNGGDTQQANSSSAGSSAGNGAGTFQALGQSQLTNL